MFAWLTLPLMVSAVATAESPETFVLTFQPDADILTVDGYRAARDAAAAFQSLPTGFPHQPYVWITDCRDEGPYSLEWAVEAELMAQGVGPGRFFQDDDNIQADPCQDASVEDRTVLVGVRNHDGGPWLSHHDMRGVYFKPGSSVIADEWRPTIRRARAYVSTDSFLDITGHTDTAEDNAAELSQARADAYRDVMVRMGVPDWQMRSEGMSADQLARATPESTAEPLNRRVSINIRRVNWEKRTPGWWFEQRDAWFANRPDAVPSPPSAD